MPFLVGPVPNSLHVLDEHTYLHIRLFHFHIALPQAALCFYGLGDTKYYEDTLE